MDALKRRPPTSYVQESLKSLVAGHETLVDAGEAIERVKTAFSMQIAEHRFSQPSEPNPSQLVCRVFSSEKIIRFLAKPGFFLCPPADYGDRYEGLFPAELILEFKTGAESWVRENFADERERETALFACRQISKAEYTYPPGTCSCWTLFDMREGFSEPLWQVHAGGRNGVAIVCEYQHLKRHFEKETHDENLVSGLIDYSMAGSNVHPAFRKRRAFSHEREVRFFSPLNEQAWSTEFIHHVPKLRLEFFEDVDPLFEISVLRLAERLDIGIEIG
ncbi:MAG: hypothetical protein AAF483_29910 [Planctomycetota bacterium]